jgi:hypothetical protein
MYSPIAAACSGRAGDAERRARAPVTLPGRGLEYDADPVGHNADPVERRLENGRENECPNHGHVPHGYGSRAAGGAEPLPEDGEGPCTRDQLLRMDQSFVAAVERAFQNGGEHRQSAAMNGATGSRSR